MKSLVLATALALSLVSPLAQAAGRNTPVAAVEGGAKHSPKVWSKRMAIFDAAIQGKSLPSYHRFTRADKRLYKQALKLERSRGLTKGAGSDQAGGVVWHAKYHGGGIGAFKGEAATNANDTRLHEATVGYYGGVYVPGQ